MIKSFFIILAATGAIAAADIVASKDSLRIYNNPVSSFADEVWLKNRAAVAVDLDSAFLLVDEMDTTGSGAYGGLGDRFMVRWKRMNPSRTDMWSLVKMTADTYRLTPASSSSSIRPSLYLSSPGDSLIVAFMELGTCLGCSGIPTWYPPYFRGMLLLHFTNGETVTIRLYSEDMRRFLPSNQPCTDYACDSMNVRKILDRNGMGSVPVSEVSTGASGRITSLLFVYNPAGSLSLPKPITVIPDEIGNLTALLGFSAGGNEIESISPRIGRCGSLRNITANNNGISTLPDSIVQCRQLQYIKLENNRLTRLPDSIGKMQSLLQLSVTGNLLTTLPASIVQLDSLSCMFIEKNRICTLPDSVISWLAEVRARTYCARAEARWPDSQECATVATTTRQRSEMSHLPVVRLRATDKVLSVNVGAAPDRITAVALVDLAGKTVSRAYPSSGLEITLPIGGLARGIYTAVLFSGVNIAGVRQVLIDR